MKHATQSLIAVFAILLSNNSFAETNCYGDAYSVCGKSNNATYIHNNGASSRSQYSTNHNMGKYGEYQVVTDIDTDYNRYNNGNSSLSQKSRTTIRHRKADKSWSARDTGVSTYDRNMQSTFGDDRRADRFSSTYHKNTGTKINEEGLSTYEKNKRRMLGQ